MTSEPSIVYPAQLRLPFAIWSKSSKSPASCAHVKLPSHPITPALGISSVFDPVRRSTEDSRALLAEVLQDWVSPFAVMLCRGKSEIKKQNDEDGEQERSYRPKSGPRCVTRGARCIVREARKAQVCVRASIISNNDHCRVQRANELSQTYEDVGARVLSARECVVARRLRRQSCVLKGVQAFCRRNCSSVLNCSNPRRNPHRSSRRAAHHTDEDLRGHGLCRGSSSFASLIRILGDA
ncbi:uncharacterized protein SCHCODRAFT_02080307 [Schizophyllum commune H4-8]|uniref:uncharacterized protein n=1 Tax=Schizophyllum commune (strain H4-8 / FGSC 9210) TaxID=578458 RepID=UPI0021600901|nr:uncharacterized protein SCHCODRAFT_02080307 [Schizophyllum commune H4-8]KAI5886748.1 hypothetical protein SCHCODRAFT_02080307 [Schizophyllum commune H4-8]